MSKSNAAPAVGRPPRTVKPKLGKLRLFLMAALILLAGLLVAACFVPAGRWAEGTGYITTEREAEVRPSAEGAIAAVLVEDGQEVKEGELLLQLKDSVQRASCEQSRRQLRADQARLDHLISVQSLDTSKLSEQIFQAKRRLTVAQNRLKKMQSSSSGFSKQEVEEARLEVDLATSRVAELELPRAEVMAKQITVLKEGIEAGRKAVTLHEAQVSLRQVRAAVSGVLALNRFAIGEVVKPDHVLGQIFDRGSSWLVRLKLSERDISYVRTGQRVRVELSARPSWRYGYLWATVSRITPVITPRSTGDGIFHVEATMDDSGEVVLNPGMSVRAAIDTGQTTWLYRLLGW